MLQRESTETEKGNSIICGNSINDRIEHAVNDCAGLLLAEFVLSGHFLDKFSFGHGFTPFFDEFVFAGRDYTTRGICLQ